MLRSMEMSSGLLWFVTLFFGCWLPWLHFWSKCDFSAIAVCLGSVWCWKIKPLLINFQMLVQHTSVLSLCSPSWQLCNDTISDEASGNVRWIRWRFRSICQILWQVLGVFFLNDMTFRSCLSAIDVFFFMLVFVYGFVLFFRCDTFSSVLYLSSFLTFFMDTQHNTLRYSKFLATSSLRITLLLKKKILLYACQTILSLKFFTDNEMGTNCAFARRLITRPKLWLWFGCVLCSELSVMCVHPLS